MPVKAIGLGLLLVCGLLAGCYVVDLAKPAGPPSNEQIYAVYRQITPKQSNSAEVLTVFGQLPDALLSQSKSIIAIAGQQRKGYRTWFDMVTFDENSMAAKRKYVLISDERPRKLFVEPWEGVYFDCKMVLDRKILDEPYANENARRMAILKQIGADIRKDTKEIGTDNEAVGIGGMITGQAIDAVLTKLDGSPALAGGLIEDEGLEFEDMSFDKGRLRMVVEGDVATVMIRLGSFAKKWSVGFTKAPQAD